MYFDYKKDEQDILQTSGKEKPENNGPELIESKPVPEKKKPAKRPSRSKFKFGATKHRR